MNANKFRKVLEQLELSQVKAGELVGRDGRTARRWVASGPPNEVSIIFQMLADGTITIQDVEAARKRAGV